MFFPFYNVLVPNNVSAISNVIVNEDTYVKYICGSFAFEREKDGLLNAPEETAMPRCECAGLFCHVFSCMPTATV